MMVMRATKGIDASRQGLVLMHVDIAGSYLSYYFMAHFFTLYGHIVFCVGGSKQKSMLYFP